MNVPIFTLIYGAVLHLCSIVGLVVLIALNKGPTDAEWALLTALVTAAIALPVTINPVRPAQTPPAAIEPSTQVDTTPKA